MKLRIIAFLLFFCNFKLILSNVKNSTQDLFNNIYQTNGWRNSESKSGPGSTIFQTRKIRTEIPKLFKKLNIKVFLDAPCGDLNWMKTVNFNFLDSYVGIDIVPQIIERNRSQYANDKRNFIHADIITDDLPSADIVLCRDCLVHLSYEDIFKALNNFKRAGITYLLTTTYTTRTTNTDIPTGKWRPINLQQAPFNFPSPIYLINEGCTECNPRDGSLGDKCLGLWKLDELITEYQSPNA